MTPAPALDLTTSLRGDLRTMLGTQTCWECPPANGSTTQCLPRSSSGTEKDQDAIQLTADMLCRIPAATNILMKGSLHKA